MKVVVTIIKKELLLLFSNSAAYIFAGLLMLVSNWLFFETFFVQNQANLNSYWGLMAYLLSLFIPAITMNLVAEEKKSNTWEVLSTLPTNEGQIVAAKFIASLLYVWGVLLLTVPLIVTIYFLGNKDIGVLTAGFLGIAFMSAVYVAVGTFASSLTRQPIAAFLIALIILLINNLINQDVLLASLPTLARDIISYLSISWHSGQLASGLLSLSDLTFFTTSSAFLILLSVAWLKTRNK